MLKILNVQTEDLATKPTKPEDQRFIEIVY